MPSQTTTSHGQVIEYIQDRLYLASYTHPPNSATPFPYGAEASSSSRSPSKRSKTSSKKSPVYFTIDDELLYNRFHADFGPLHIAHLYRFAVRLHEILGDTANTNRPVVYWSRADPRSRANAACLLACYMVLIQSWPPHLALAPIAQADPPYMPFRDAGYSQADYGLSVQDVVYGVWKAKEEGLCELKDFSLEEYERYERVDQGDFNWVSPDFVAFASPQHRPVAPLAPASAAYAALPKDVDAVRATGALPEPFRNVLCHFSERNVGLVVRLNSELYSPSYFTAMGMEHVDMIFDDGTCPPLSVVRRFIRLAHDMITRAGRGVAVHCKAGLGRTGCLIGAYLIYRHGFTANDLIAYMRFMRPGMVVGPQQHWLHINQGTFRQWWWEDEYKAKIALTMPVTPTKGNRSPHHVRAKHDVISHTATPPAQTTGSNGGSNQSSAKRAALEEIDSNEHRASSGGTTAPSSPTKGMDENLPAPTPGQPRKTARTSNGSPLRGASSSSGHRGGSSGTPFDIATDADVPPVPEIPEEHVNNGGSKQGQGEQAVPTADEEWALRRLSRSRKSPGSKTSPTAAAATYSPGSACSGKPRAISYTTTTTRTTYTTVCEETSGGSGGEDNGGELAAALAADQCMSDVENWDAAGGSGAYYSGNVKVINSKSPSRASTGKLGGSNSSRSKSGSGAGSIGVAKVRASAGAALGGGGNSSPTARRGAGESKSLGEKAIMAAGGAGVRKSSGRVGSVNARASSRREMF